MTTLRSVLAELANAYAQSNRQSCTRDDFGAGHDAAKHEAAEAIEQVLRQYPTTHRCRCGVLVSMSHYCSAMEHCWVSGVPEQTTPNPHGEHLASKGKPIDGYPLQQA